MNPLRSLVAWRFSPVALAAIIALIILGAAGLPQAWGADPAQPAAKAEDYPAAAPAPGTSSPAADAGHGAASALVQASKPWYSDLGSLALLGGTAAVVALEKTAPALLMRFLPMAGPYGGVLQLVLQALLWLLKPKAQKEAEQLQADHADAFRALASTIQTVSNAAPVADLKQRLLTHLDPAVRSTIDDFVAELKAQGINHDVPGSGTLVVSINPAAPASAAR